MRKPLVSVTKKDLEVTWFSGSGAGGQHRNRHQNCCRIYHPASGARATGQESRSRVQNCRRALHRLTTTSKFFRWLNLKQWEAVNNKTIEELVAEQCRPEYFKVEVRKNGEWVDE
jgi:protein subunit release factor A